MLALAWLVSVRRRSGLRGLSTLGTWLLVLLSLLGSAYPADVSHLWCPPGGWDADDMSLEIDDHLCVWTHGSAEVNNLATVTAAGAGAYLPALALALQGSTWGRS